MEKLNSIGIHGNFSVSQTISEAAESILKHSFAIYRVDDDTANDVSTAWLEARSFFASPNDKSSFHQVVNGNLHGFHVPSDAKLLFRAFCGSSQQPWPNDEFQSASKQVAEKLHRLLIDCVEEMIEQQIRSGETAQEDGDDTSIPSNKRLKLTSPLDDLPLSAQDTDSCPLDYFFYHANKPYSTSCSEHVDRGVLICVCLTNVPGLELLPRGEADFVCPEIHTHNASLYSEKRVFSGLVCIMAGDQLGEVAPQVKACVHRVRNELKSSRLSITYELRVPPLKR